MTTMKRTFWIVLCSVILGCGCTSGSEKHVKVLMKELGITFPENPLPNSIVVIPGNGCGSCIQGAINDIHESVDTAYVLICHSEKELRLLTGENNISSFKNVYLDKKNVSIYENQVLTYPVIYTIKNDGSIVYEPYTAQKRTSTNVRLTMMDISPASIELGTISKNGVYKDSVKVTNIGKDTLFIEDIQSSCECTQVDWKKEPIALSETVWLYITFRPDMIGEFERYVTVYSNVKQSPIEIPIKGTIK